MTLDPSRGIVLDATITCAWAFPDEQSDYADAVQNALLAGSIGLAPCLWLWEVGNVLIQGEKRGRITEADTVAFVSRLISFNIEIDATRTVLSLSSIQAVARRYQLTVYDAEYLWLALERNYCLATLDRDLIRAAEPAGVMLFVTS